MRRLLPINSDHLVFALLVAIAVAGRVGRFDWNFTPVAAAALFAGFYFRNRLIASLVPLAALAVSDLGEPAHNSRWVLLTVWASMLLPAMLGPWLRNARSIRQSVARGAASALLPSAAFFMTTNFAVWAANVPAAYSRDLVGLATCYAAGIPFYARMLAGDLFYMAALFGAYAWIVSTARQPQSAARVA